VQVLRGRIEAAGKKTTSVAGLLPVIEAFLTLAPLLAEGERRHVANQLTDRALAHADVSRLREILPRLGPWADHAVIRKHALTCAPEVIRQLAMEKWVSPEDETLSLIFQALRVEDLRRLLELPTCTGPAEDLVLAALSKKLGRPVTNVWALEKDTGRGGKVFD
jgi:hypothetical protein